MFKYPRICNWLSFEKASETEYLVKDHLWEVEYCMDASVLEFARKLDGRRDPYSIDPSLSRREVRHVLQYLRDHDLIRSSRFLLDTLDYFSYTLWIPKWEKISKTVAIIISALLFFLWLPVLIRGISLFIRNFYMIDISVSVLGLFVGTLCGMILHELAHGFTAAACGASVFEFGVCLKWFLLPGAYTLMNDDHCSRFKRIQILAAGVEANFLLVGISLMFTSISRDGSFWYSVALINAFMALMNLVIYEDLDGYRIFLILLGGDFEYFMDNAKKVVKSSAKRRALRRKGIAGHAIIALAYVLFAVRIFIPVLLIINVLGVFGWLN